MSLNIPQRLFVSLTVLCMSALLASACHSGQTAASADAQPIVQPTSQPSPQPAQSGAPGLKKVDLTAADRAAWRKTLNWPNECEEAYEATAGNDQAGLRFFELAPNKYLVEVRCAFGAYQREHRYMLYDESRTPPGAQLLTFENYIAGDDTFESLEREETTEMWGEAKFDPKTRELTILRVFRGPGDCGAWARYSFDQGSPRLLEFRAKTACDGKPAGDPRKWRKLDLTAGKKP